MWKYVGEEMYSFLLNRRKFAAQQKKILTELPETKKELLDLWSRKWNMSQTEEKKYFCKLLHCTYGWIKCNAKVHRKKNFIAKFLFLAVSLLGFSGYGTFFIWNILKDSNSAVITLLENGILLLLIIGFSRILTKWIDVKKYQETWARHSTHQFLLEKEMLQYIFDLEPYDSDEKDKTFMTRFLAIEAMNQEKFAQNMETGESKIEDYWDFVKK